MILHKMEIPYGNSTLYIVEASRMINFSEYTQKNLHSQPLSIAIIELADLSRSNLPPEVKCPPGTGYFEPF